MKKWLILILLLAAFLRFYRMPEYLRFLGDEGRDVLVVKRMIVDHQWTLLGPTASVGGFYTGPIYYYFMLPFLWVFNLNPVGPAVMSALFGLATIVLIYLFCKDFFDEKTALIATFLTTISPKMIETSRFSWNPNPIPFFALGTIYSLYKSVSTKRKLFTFISGIGLGILYQLHYIDLVFIPIVGLSLLLIFPIRQWFIQILVMFLGFLAGDSLFLIFELRHGFPNTKTAFDFIFDRKGATVSPRSYNLIWLINEMSRILYEIVLGFRGTWLNIIYYLSLVIFGLWAIKTKQKTKIILLLVWWLLGTFGVGLYRGTLLDHYFEYLFPIPIIFTAVLGAKLLTKKIFYPLFLLLVGAILYLSVPKLYFFLPPNNQVIQTQTIDKIVIELSQNKPYNFGLITAHNSNHAYLYFLEIWNHKPVVLEPPQTDPDRKTITDQLIVVCEESCEPEGNASWEVAGFGRGKISEVREAPAGIKVYKLLHYKGE